MYRCLDCNGEFEDVDSMYIPDKDGYITDYVEICPICGSINIVEIEDTECENKRELMR